MHVGVPAVGVGTYLGLLRRIRAAGIDPPPTRRLFALFFSYGGWLLILLTGLLWFWSGIASLGMFYLVGAAPLVLVAVAVRTWPERSRSPYHRAIFWTAVAYPLLVAAVAVAAALAEAATYAA